MLIKRNSNGALLAYKQIYDDKNNNSHGHISGKSDTTSGRSSRVVPEGGVVFIGNDCSMPVIALKSLQWTGGGGGRQCDINEPDQAQANVCVCHRFL